MASADIIRSKLARIREGAAPRVLDLFSGCGGLSLGFQSIGFEMSAAVEFDEDAARSYGVNFHNGDPRHTKARDITDTRPEDLASELELGRVGGAFDVLIGGPPCQAFARVGRPKLREIEAHPQAFRRDPRARLYQEYLRYIESFEPLAILVENVPDVLNHAGQNIAEEMCGVLEDKGYVCGYTLLNSAFYGVPQMRERMFLVAYHRAVGASVRFPIPTHYLELPSGYKGSRGVALKVLNGSVNDAHNYIEPPNAASSLQRAVTAEDALNDLPPIYAQEQLAEGSLKRGARKLDKSIALDRPKNLPLYAKLMRQWPGFELPEEGVADHVIRYLPRDYRLFARMEPGDQYPEAYRLAVALFEKELASLRRNGHKLRAGSAAFDALKASVVPPYDASKFPNKWRKMWRDKPARTLMAHLSKDSYSHIHYDSAQARTISVREAARLQSFPDGFIFCGTMNPA
ncbi:MAG TPA: DNA cytosine methyltransferase, partial [Steroidobacteraceae bacterium]|nr:DNA cytosine methyltransferase [Steroidobacteraceae bacterium]